jgi:hypothetical protein
MQSLHYFRNLQNPAGGRWDEHEGASHYFPKEQIGTIKFGSITIPGSELGTDVVMRPVALDRLNLFCLYSACAPPFKKGDLVSQEQIEAHFRFPDDCAELGPLAVVIREPSTLFARFDAAVKREVFDLDRSRVTYYDPTVMQSEFKHPHFVKRKKFEGQREYRFAIDRFANDPDAAKCELYTLDVGSLEDLCIPCDSSRLNDELRVTMNTDSDPSG